VPFTNGILIGIGETLAERAESVFAIRQVAREYGGIQEVIVQNFRAKPDTAMRDAADAELGDLAATIAVTRLVLGPSARIQAPPNLIAGQYPLILAAGIDDWGGVSPLTPDHVNPERPWPQLDDLAAQTAAAGFELRERLTVYPGYQREPWLDPRLAGHVAALADPATGLAAPGAMPSARPWQEPDGGWGDASGRTDLHVTIDTSGRSADRRADFAEVYGDWAEIGARIDPAARAGSTPCAATAARRGPRRTAPGRGQPGRADRRRGAGLLSADGPELDALAELADGLRRDAIGDDITYVVNRNINFTNVCYTGCRFCAFAQRRTDADVHAVPGPGRRPGLEAWAAARPRCMQGGIHRTCRHAYLDLAPRSGGAAGPAHPRVLADGGDERVGADRAAGARVADPAREAALTRCPAPPRRSSTTTSAGC
jgi:FO synthase